LKLNYDVEKREKSMIFQRNAFWIETASKIFYNRELTA